MERPGHSVDAIIAGSKKSRTVATSVVIGIHVVIVVALIVGLRVAAMHKELLSLNASVEQAKAVPKAPPPPPPDLIRPPPPTSVVPDFAIVAPPPKAAPAPPAPAAPIAKVAPTKLESITRTHTLPPYPTISQRLGEQGTTTIKVTISVEGNVTAAVLEKSSGSDRLDQAAIEYVKEHWRWKPPTREGKPVEATTLVSVVWNLRNAQ
jgi:protein TonB